MTEEFENTLVAEPGEVYEEVQVKPVQAPATPNWNILDIFELARAEADDPDDDEAVTHWLIDNFFNQVTDQEFANLRSKWSFWARPNQLAPGGDWTFWLLLAGRGFGKTRTGAEWINERVLSGKSKRIALVAPTAADVRKVMVEGESGLLAISPPWNRPLFEPSKLQLTWPNGAIAQLFSAEEPERLRGPQCDTFWADELAAWKKLQDTWDMLQFGFRLGSDPRGVITTTPKPLPIIKELMADNRELPEEKRSDKWNGQTVITRGSTYENRANLAPKFFQQVVSTYEGTRLGRQELDAEILEDMPGALWARSNLDKNRISAPTFPGIYEEAGVTPGSEAIIRDLDMLRSFADQIISAVGEDLTRVVVAVDPNTSNNEGSDEIGIVVNGKGLSGRGYVLADCSMRGSPNEWASAAVIAHDVFRADRIIGEANQGGNMVEHTIKTAAKSLKDEGKRTSDHVGITLVHATRGKVTRAEPASALYEQNRVSHVSTMKVLEDQMCLFTSDFDRKAMGYSPDRVDALVWGLTHLFHEEQDGSGIFEYMKQEAQKVREARADTAPEDYVRMKAPNGVGVAYGQTGTKYRVVNGHVVAKPEDIPGLRNGGFIEA
jgi:phage terminase large subunit-like protein